MQYFYLGFIYLPCIYTFFVSLCALGQHNKVGNRLHFPFCLLPCFWLTFLNIYGRSGGGGGGGGYISHIEVLIVMAPQEQ